MHLECVLLPRPRQEPGMRMQTGREAADTPTCVPHIHRIPARLRHGRAVGKQLVLSSRDGGR